MKPNAAVSKQKQKRKWEPSPKLNMGSSDSLEGEKTRRRSFRFHQTTSNAPSDTITIVDSRLAERSSQESVQMSDVSRKKRKDSCEVVIFKYSQTDPIAIAFQQKLSQLPLPAVTLGTSSGNLATLPIGFEFIQHLKIGKGAAAYDSQFVASCSCPPGASACKDMQKCTCIDEPGTFTYSRPNIMREGRSNRVVIFECHRGCLCGDDCRNRVVQRGRQIPLELFWAGTKGWGLRCPEKLPRGALVDKYFGEVIGPRESSRRASINDGKGVTYLFNLDKFETPRAQYHAIDGEHMGGISRFINHSCDPNLTVYAVVSDRRDTKVYDIAFFTNRVINPGEELTYDYVECLEGDKVKPVTSWDCSCGSAQCRGRIF